MNTHVIAARKRRRLTQAELAQRVRVYRTGIALVELHDWLPPAPVRRRIAKELNASEEALFADVLRLAQAE